MNKELKGSLILILAALIWGAAFVAQDAGVGFVEPFTFNAVRWAVGTLTLLPVMLFSKSKNQIKGVFHRLPQKYELIGGSICGVLLFVSSSFQQMGISFYGEGEAAAGKAGFITALYIILVPVFSLFLGKKVPFSVWIAICVAVVGMYLLCITNEFKISVADILIFLCAVSFTFHILTVDSFSDKTNGIKFSVVQMFVCGVLSFIAMMIFEKPTLENILRASVPLLYAGVLSSGVAYTLQIVGQKMCSPTVASVIMSLESVFAALTGALFGERMSGREILGGALMFVAVILAQIDIKKIFKNNSEKSFE